MEIISQEVIQNVAYNLLANAATKYPKNYLEKLFDSLKREENPVSKSIIFSIIQNLLHAVEGPASLCQDTGIPAFHVFLTPNIAVKGLLRGFNWKK